jgi:hypothetical protein
VNLSERTHLRNQKNTEQEWMLFATSKHNICFLIKRKQYVVVKNIYRLREPEISDWVSFLSNPNLFGIKGFVVLERT